MQDLGDLVDLAFEHSDGRGIGEHQRSSFLVNLASEGLEVDAAFGVGLEVLDAVAADGGCGRVGAVRGVGDEDPATRVSLRLVPGADQQDAGELAMGAGGGLEGDGVHAGDFDEALLEQVNHIELALREVVGTIRMGFGEAFNPGDQLVHAGVVFHSAGAERVHAEIDGVVPGGEPGEVADDLDLAQLGEFGGDFPVGVAQQRRGIDCGHIEQGKLVSFLAG